MESSSYVIIFLLLFFLCNFSSVLSKHSDADFHSQATYARLCNTVVPASPLHDDAETVHGVAESLNFESGFFSGGGNRLFNQSAALSHSNRASFRVTSVQRSYTDGVYALRGRVILRQREGVGFSRGRLLLGVRVFPGRRVSHWSPKSQWMRASLSGFWSQSSGKLCMFGNGSSGNVVLKLRYPTRNNVTIFDDLVIGTLESFDDKNSLHYFEPVSILALSRSDDYKFTLVGNDKGNGCVAGSDGEEGLSLGNLDQRACASIYRYMNRFELEYGSQCRDVSCNPLGAGVEKLPGFMHFSATRCMEKGKVQMLLGFPDSTYTGFVFPFHPNTTLISEGVWDEKKNQLCAVVCRILNFTGSSANVGDCSIKLNLRFPAVLSLRNRSTVLGHIWSDKAVGESGYFSKIGFQGTWKVSSGLQYKYTEIERVRKSCSEKMMAGGKGKMYPGGHSSDAFFNMLVTNTKGQVARGYSSPLFVGDQSYEGLPYRLPSMLTTGKIKPHNIQHDNLLNVSYTMSFSPPPDFKFGSEVSSTEVKIGAEGIYNRNTGFLCMVGCRPLRSTDKILTKNESLDCEIMVNVQFPPLNAKAGESVKGTIESTRQKSDPHYFDPLKLSSNSIYTSQADASIWRMDLEIIMVMISNTLACVFVGLQLLHVKKHPDLLPHISIVMLVVITLGHMIPLMLNFEALFKPKHNNAQNAFLWSGGWLEVNEVVMRMVTMVAFLLELRLVHLTWSSRQSEGSEPGLWVSEKRVLQMTLPLYIAGGLTAWFVHIWKNSRQKRYEPLHLSRHFRSPRIHLPQPPTLWEDLRSYGGLLQDGFLLPQILYNMLVNSEGKALASAFYVGTTIVRVLPHAYDLYRAHSFAWYLDLSYIYANHRMDFYSTAWDIIIPIGGLLFALIIFFQQRFGSRCILPKRFRENSAYEKVPAIGNNDL